MTTTTLMRSRRAPNWHAIAAVANIFRRLAGNLLRVARAAAERLPSTQPDVPRDYYRFPPF